jgi:hypothetical protein
MQEDKSIPWPFDESEIHFVEAADGERLTPLMDLADAIGYSRRGLHRIVEKEQDVFQGWAVNLPSENPTKAGDRQSAIALTGKGVILLLMHVTASRIKDPKKREKILRYQHWSMDAVAAHPDIEDVIKPLFE